MKCSVDECDKDVVARGWCGMHYRRWRLYGNLDKPPGRPVNIGQTKEAPGEPQLCECHGEPMSWQKHKNCLDGGFWKCRVKLSQYARDHRLRQFGLTEDAYDKLLAKQYGVCAICGGPPDTRWKRLAIDHDHETGEVRGLLCMTCNTMLGRLERRWDATMLYLKK